MLFWKGEVFQFAKNVPDSVRYQTFFIECRRKLQYLDVVLAPSSSLV